MSVPTVVAVVQQHRAALLAREQATMQAAAARWLGVETALNAQVDALALELANTGTPTWGQLIRSRRYAALRQQVAAELDKYAGYMDDTITRGQRNMAVMALEHSARAIDAVATQAGIVAPFDRISIAAVEDMIGLAGDGTPLRAILDDAAAGAGDALGQQLVNGIALGKNPITVARQAMRLGLGASFTRMQAISRTEQLRAYRTSSLAQYEASRVVVAYKRLSARDRRTCPACLFADGQQYPIEYGFDEHVQGRCTMIPVLANVPPVRFEDGQSWFRSQPEATQLAILGRGRYDLWRRGEATLDDMVSRDWSDTWGGSLRATSVGRLRNGGGRVWTGGGPVAPRGVAAPVSAPRVPEWQPAMSRADAELWAANSVYKGDTYHVTPGVANERSIKANGFDLSKKKFGRIWGDGVYVGTDQGAAKQYQRWTGKGARTLKIMTDVRNPAIFDARGGSFTQEDVLRGVLNLDRATARRMWSKANGDLTGLLRQNGYDALELRNVTEAAGGNQMVVFDPKKVVVINE